MLKTASSSIVRIFTGVAVTTAVLSVSSVPMAHAAGGTGQFRATMPVTISALCQQTNGMPKWRIGNPNPNPITLTWDDADEAGVTVPYGYTSVTTALDADDDTATVIFHQDGVSDAVVPTNPAECASPLTNCVDGFTRANLAYTWSPKGVIGLATKDGAPLCDDVTVYVSAYTLPKTYDESGIFDDSALPQQLFSSTSAVLHKGTDGAVTLTTAVPDACTDYQLDAYYAPEITTVSYHGQGAQLIYGDITLHTKTDCSITTPPATGGHGGGQVLAASTTKPAATLADTGDSTTLPVLASLTLMAAALFVKFPLLGRVKQLFVK